MILRSTRTYEPSTCHVSQLTSSMNMINKPLTQDYRRTCRIKEGGEGEGEGGGEKTTLSSCIFLTPRRVGRFGPLA